MIERKKRPKWSLYKKFTFWLSQKNYWYKHRNDPPSILLMGGENLRLYDPKPKLSKYTEFKRYIISFQLSNIPLEFITMFKLLCLNLQFAFLARYISNEYLIYHNILIIPNSLGDVIYERFFNVCIIAPILEETIFRVPLFLLTLFILDFRKFQIPLKIFLFCLYIFISILFGLIHLSNYITPVNLTIIDMIMITSPQIIGGFFLGYTAIKFEDGFRSSVILHSSYNFFALLIGLLINT